MYNVPPSAAELDADQRESLLHVLRLWRESAESRGIQPWLLYMPTKFRVAHSRVEIDPQADERFQTWSHEDLQQAVGEITATLGIGFVDPVPCLIESTSAGVLPYNTVFDSHLNSRGSDCVADALVTALGPHFEPRS